MKKITKKAKITTDDLAIMVAKGFDGIDKRFDGVDSRLDKVENRLDKVEEKVEKLDNNIQATRRDVLNMGDKFVSYYTFDQLANRVNILENEKKSGARLK